MEAHTEKTEAEVLANSQGSAVETVENSLGFDESVVTVCRISAAKILNEGGHSTFDSARKAILDDLKGKPEMSKAVPSIAVGRRGEVNNDYPLILRMGEIEIGFDDILLYVPVSS